MTAPIPRARLDRLSRMMAEWKRRQARKIQSQRGGLIEFVRYFWPVLEPARDLVEGWPLEAMCLHLEAVTFGEISRLLENVPPGFMKSLLVNVFWPAWEWGPMDMTSMRYVAFSYAASLTERDNGKFRDLILSRPYQELWSHRFKLRAVGVTKIENDKTGWKLASSVGGVGTGERGDRVILDDPHNVKEAESERVRSETVRWFTESMSNRLNDDSSAIVVIMQRVHDADVSGEIISAEMGYVHLMIPWDYDPGRHCQTDIGWEDPRTEDGEEAWPERFGEEFLAPFRKRPYMWSAQYLQSPVPRGGGIIKREHWKLWDPPDGKTFPPFELVLAFLDTAYTKDKQNDPSGMIVAGVWRDAEHNPNVMLAYAWTDWLEFNALVERVAKACRDYKVDRLLIEARTAGHSVAQEIRRVHSRAQFGVQLIDPKSQDKVARLHSVEHLFEDGMVWAPDRNWADAVISQCEAGPLGAHDEYADCMSGVLRFLRDSGLLLRKEEAEFERVESMKYRRKSAPLYPS